MPRTKPPQGKSLVDQIREAAKAPAKTKKVPSRRIECLIPTGSTLLNLACSDDPRGGFGVGTVVNIIGDSDTGKTILALGCLAELAHTKRFKDYQLHYRDIEAAFAVNVAYLFGDRTAKRVNMDENLVPDTIEDFEDEIMGLIDDDEPFVYILDSLDALDAKADQAKARERREARSKGEQEVGSYGAAKPKQMSELLRRIVRKLKHTRSLLLIVSQTRDNLSSIGFTKKSVSGGRALEFYCTHRMWLAKVKTLKRKVRGKDHPIGIATDIKVSKNKLTGKKRNVGFQIFYDYGIDDIASCVDWLVKMGEWDKAKRGPIDAVDFGVKFQRSELIAYIEEEGLEIPLRKLVWKVWQEIEETLTLNRKRRYR